MIILTALAAAGALLLVWAGIDHLREPGVLAKRLAMSLGLIEIAVGATVVTALVVELPGGRLLILAQAALYLAFLGYLAMRYRRQDRGDCACARVSAVIGPVGLLRAGVQSVIGVAVAIGYPATTLPPTASALSLCLAASVVLCLLFHALPPAMDGLARQRRYV